MKKKRDFKPREGEKEDIDLQNNKDELSAAVGLILIF